MLHVNKWHGVLFSQSMKEPKNSLKPSHTQESHGSKNYFNGVQGWFQPLYTSKAEVPSHWDARLYRDLSDTQAEPGKERRARL